MATNDEVIKNLKLLFCAQHVTDEYDFIPDLEEINDEVMWCMMEPAERRGFTESECRKFLEDKSGWGYDYVMEAMRFEIAKLK